MVVLDPVTKVEELDLFVKGDVMATMVDLVMKALENKKCPVLHVLLELIDKLFVVVAAELIQFFFNLASSAAEFWVETFLKGLNFGFLGLGGVKVKRAPAESSVGLEICCLHCEMIQQILHRGCFQSNKVRRSLAVTGKMPVVVEEFGKREL